MRKFLLVAVSVVGCYVAVTQSADAQKTANDSSPVHRVIEPLALGQILKSSEGFSKLPPWPKGMVLSGNKEHSARSIFAGEISVSIYEGTDEVIKEDSHWVDEFVQILHGEAILTSAGGETHHFKVGDFFIVPKGWKGTWEARDGYKELVVVDTKANAASSPF
jgi:uncharacterized cupin superfamily protein